MTAVFNPPLSQCEALFVTIHSHSVYTLIVLLVFGHYRLLEFDLAYADIPYGNKYGNKIPFAGSSLFQVSLTIN